MGEISVFDNVIIDSVDEVLSHLSIRLGLTLSQSIDLDKVVEFIQTQDNTKFYVDERFNVKTETSDTVYLFLDTGLLDKNGEIIFISMLNSGGYYHGHIVADYKYLASGIARYYTGNTRQINFNKGRFKNVYDGAICHREIAHLDTELVITVNQADYDEVDLEIVDTDKNTDAVIISEKNVIGSTFVKPEAMLIADDVKNILMFNNFKTDLGLDRYLKICGARLSQLIESDNNDYYLYDGNMGFAVINTGLLDKFGRDILILYKEVESSVYRFIPWSIIESKSDIMYRGFSKTDANKNISPIRFFDNESDRVFDATLDDFDVSTQALIHIIDGRRDRFMNVTAGMSDSALVAKISDAIERGITIQARDNSYIKATYSGKVKSVAWLFPLHINRELTEDPELALVVSKNNYFYEIKTILPYDDTIKDRLTCLALYSS